MSYSDSVTSSDGATKVNRVSRHVRLCSLGISPLPVPATAVEPSRIVNVTFGSPPSPFRLALASHPVKQ